MAMHARARQHIVARKLRCRFAGGKPAIDLSALKMLTC
jgi:hypothetical protein